MSNDSLHRKTYQHDSIAACEDDTDFLGNEMAVIDDVESAQACSDMCKQTDGCRSFTYALGL